MIIWEQHKYIIDITSEVLMYHQSFIEVGMLGTSWNLKNSMYKQETTGLKLFLILASKFCLK